MNQNMTEHESCKQTCCSKCMSWGGIFAGALVAIGLSFLLNSFGVAIGLSAFKVSADGALVFAIGGCIGIVIGTIVVMFLAGWVAGHLNRTYCYKKCHGALYGFITWCLALIFMVMLAGNTTEFISTSIKSMTNNHPEIVELVSTDISEVKGGNAKEKADKIINQEIKADEKTMQTLSLVVFLTFGLFLLGALASAFGGYCGVGCRNECKNQSCC